MGKSSSHCKGSLLTLSVTAREVGVVQSYLYWNGQITRFMAQDVKTIFPRLFNMKWNAGKPLAKGGKSENERFMENTEELDALIAKMQERLRDKNFEHFHNRYS